jgi:hypothetical protein
MFVRLLGASVKQKPVKSDVTMSEVSQMDVCLTPALEWLLTLLSPCTVHQVTSQLVALMGWLEGRAEETPPLQQPMRFGNKAYRLWHAKFVEVCPLRTH